MRSLSGVKSLGFFSIPAFLRLGILTSRAFMIARHYEMDPWSDESAIGIKGGPLSGPWYLLDIVLVIQ